MSEASSSVASNDARYAALQGITLVPRGFLIPKVPANAWLVARATQQLTYQKPENRYASKYAKKEPPLRLYLDSPEHVLVPKFWALQAFRGKGVPVCNANEDGEPIAVHYRDDVPLVEERRRPQQSAFAYAMEHLGRTGGALMVLPVGCGKTNVGLSVFAACNVKTLWLTHRKNLMEQCAERAAEFVPDARIGWLYAEKMDIDDKDLVLGTVQSIGQKQYDPALFRQFGLVILDEAHHAAAPVFVDALFAVAAPRMLALTANPQRKDGLTEIIYHFFSRNAFVVQPTLPDGIALHVRAVRLFERSPVLEEDLCDARFRKKERQALLQCLRANGLPSEAHAATVLAQERAARPDDVSDAGYSVLCGALGRIAARNALLTALIKRALVTPNAEQFDGNIDIEFMRDTAFAALHDRERSTVLVQLADDNTRAPIDSIGVDRVRRHMRQCERQVIVTSMHKALVDSLRRRLVRSGVPAHMIGTYYGDAPADERLGALQKRVVLVTYAMAEEGLDVPTANTLIMAAPRGDTVEQTIGRVLRDKMTADVQPVIVDLIDQWCSMAEGMYWKRHRQYKRYPSHFRVIQIGVPPALRNMAVAIENDTHQQQQEQEQQQQQPPQAEPIDDPRVHEPGAASHRGGTLAGKRARNATNGGGMSREERDERKEERRAAKRRRQAGQVAHSVASAAVAAAAAAAAEQQHQQQHEEQHDDKEQAECDSDEEDV